MSRRRERARRLLSSARKFAKAYRASKLGLLGLLMLLLFIGLASAAPLLTPYKGDLLSPTEVNIAGERAKPAWLPSPDYSPNVAGIPDPTFGDSSQTTSKWSQIAMNDSLRGKNILTSWSDQSFPTTIDDQQQPGSLNLTLTRPAGMSLQGEEVDFTRTFSYPYAAPFAFNLRFSYNALDASNSTSIQVSIYLRQPGGATLQLCCVPQLDPLLYPLHGIKTNLYRGSWFDLGEDFLSSRNDYVKSLIFLNADYATRILKPVESYVFPTKGEYTYILKLVVSQDSASSAPLKYRLLLDNLSFRTLGNNYGILGTDEHGRDLWAQFIYGARISLFIGITAALIAVGAGTVVGLMAGYFRGAVDEFLSRITDILLVIPRLPLLFVMVAILANKQFINIVIIVGVLGWMGIARVIRSQALVIRERSFVASAKAIGAGELGIIFRHVLPNVLPLVWVNLALSIPDAIVTEAALSFLGLGDITVATWGNILNRASNASAVYEWWWTVPPGLGIALISLSFLLIGYSLDDILNPRLRRR